MKARCIQAVISALVAGTLGCSNTAYDFVHAKTGVEIARDVRICANGTGASDATCRPTDTGGVKWTRAENFDIFSLAARDESGEATIKEIVHRYLATPFWGGHLQLACKRGVDLGELPEVSVASDEIDLGRVLREESARSFEVEVFAKLPTPASPEAKAEFRKRLEGLIVSKIQVKLRWFVARFTGGRQGMTVHASLNACRNEAEQHIRDDGHLITGVAGFAVLTNAADTSITDRQNVEYALSALTGDASKLFDAGAGGAWRKTVGSVLKVDASTRQVTPTVYPLWVQLE